MQNRILFSVISVPIFLLSSFLLPASPQDTVGPVEDRVYDACESLATSFIEGILLYRNSIGSWPEDRGQLESYIDFNEIPIGKRAWYAQEISLQGEACLVRFRVTPEGGPFLHIGDNLQVQNATVLLYLTVAGDSAGFVIADETGELTTGNVRQPDSTVHPLKPLLRRQPVVRRLGKDFLRDILGIE